MTWRYIVSLERRGEGELAEDVYGIRELYEDDDGKVSWTAETVRPQGATWLELFDDLSRMTSDAARNEILDLTVDPPVVRPRRDRPRR